MSSMFQRMITLDLRTQQFSYLMTHPLPSERLTDMRIRADNFTNSSSKNSYRDNIDFYLMQKVELGLKKILEN